MIDLAFTQASSPDIASAVRAIKTLEQAIRGPIGLYNRKPTDDEHDAGPPSSCRSSSASASRRRPDRDPAIRLAIRQALEWHAARSHTATKQAAQTALASLAVTVEDNLAACLQAGWHLTAMQSGVSFEEAERELREEFRRVAAAISEDRNDQEVLDRLENRLRIQRMASERGDESAAVHRRVPYRPTIGRYLALSTSPGWRVARA